MTVENQRHTSQIVAAYVRKNLIPTDQIAGLISSVHSTLIGLGSDVVENLPLVPAVSIRRSVHADYIICLGCGFKGKMLKRHLRSTHGLSPTEYRSRWKLSSDYPMTATNYSERRSRLAKSIGLGRGRARSAGRAIEAPAQEATPEKSVRRRSVSGAAKGRTSAKKASPKTSAKVSPKKRPQNASSRSSAKKVTHHSPPRRPSTQDGE